MDIVVGTHRLVSKDVKFHDLGLVIIDEEQRFGVAQKEKLKQMCSTADVLTLSATPIPRTLNMALSGIRDMSVIEEAPHDRHPVQTYVLEYDDRGDWGRHPPGAAPGRPGVLPAQRRGLYCKAPRRASRQMVPEARIGVRPRQDERGGALRGVAAAAGPRNRRAGVHHHHRNRRGCAQRQHSDH